MKHMLKRAADALRPKTQPAAECSVINAGEITVIRNQDQIQLFHNGQPVEVEEAKKINPAVGNVVMWFVNQRNRLNNDRRKMRKEADDARKRIRVEANAHYTAGISNLQEELNSRLTQA